MKKLFTLFLLIGLILSSTGVLPLLAHAETDEDTSVAATGSLTVCKVLLDKDGNAVLGDSGPIFGVQVSDPEAFSQNVEFIPPLTLNQAILANDFNANCVAIPNLPLGEYDYGQETGSDSNTWQDPRYNDGSTGVLNSLIDNTYVFNAPDVDNANADSDGVINLTEDHPNQTLVVVNQLKAAACDADKVQTVVSDNTDTFTSDVNPAGIAVPTFVHAVWTPASSIPGATWIWDTPEVTGPASDETVVFTKNFTVTGTPISGTIDIAADNAYKVVVNGHVESDHLSDTGGASTLDFTTVAHVDIPASDLVVGNNVITITVKNLADDPNPEVNPAGLLYKVTVHSNGCDNPPPECDANISATTYVSDSSTKWDGNNDSVFVGTPYNDAWTASISGVQWIWSEDPITDAVATTTHTFTRTFNITGTPLDSSLEMAADNGFTVSVNGHAVGADPDEFNYHAPTHTYNIPAADLVTGANTITFVITNFHFDNGTPATNPGGLLYKLTVNENDCDPGNNPPPEIDNSCVAPKAFDEAGFQVVFGASSAPEKTVQQMLADGGYSIDASTEQTDTQEWDGSGTGNVNFSAGFINGQSGDIHTFGYFVNDDSTFHPVFSDGVDPDYAVPVKAPADAAVGFSVPDLSKIVFATVVYDGSTHTTYTTKNNLNAGNEQHTVTYNPHSDEYLIAFEDLPINESDHDYNDFLVSLKVTSCDQGPSCNPEINLLANGSFENTLVTSPTLWDIFTNSTPNIGWVVDWFGGSSTFGDALRPEPKLEVQKNGLLNSVAADGSQWAELDSDWDGPTGTLVGEPASVAISQTVPTVVGKAYTLNFYFAPRPGTEASDNGVDVLANGSEFGTIGATSTLADHLIWTPHPFSFIATTTSTTVTIRDNGTPNSVGTMVDGVTLMCNPDINIGGGDDPIPTPETDLQVTKSVDNETPEVNTNVTYTITVTNLSSTDDATGVAVTDILPLGTTYVTDDSAGAYATSTGVWTVGDLLHGESKNLSLTAEVTTTEDTLNTATVMSTTDDPNHSNNTSDEVKVTAHNPENPGGGDENNNEDNNDGDNQDGGGSGDPGPTSDFVSTSFVGSSGGGHIFAGGGDNGKVLGASTEDDNACGVYLTSYLRIGRKNPADQVTKLQKFLNAYLSLNIPVTGFFGPQTLAAVNQFQVQEGKNVLDPWVKAGLHDSDTDPTGYVYKTTKRWINLIMCNSLDLPIPSLP